MKTQRCPSCKEELSLDCFPPCNRGKRGEPCRKCLSIKAKARYRRDPVKAAARAKAYRDSKPRPPEYQQKWRRANIQNHLLHTASQRAKRIGVEFTLTPADLTPFPTVCAYCQRPLVVHDVKREDDSPSIDRIIPKEGYTQNNTVICCWRCNRLKNNASPEELTTLAYEVTRIIAERKIGGGGSMKEFNELMSIVPEWAKGLPISVAGYVATRYRKD